MSIEYIICQVDSTNTFAMANVLGHNTVVISPWQTGGKGRNGRRFVSALGGAYFSMVRLDDLPIEQCARYMLAAPLAVCDYLLSLGLQAHVKWPNDVLIEGAKVCGILVETVWQAGKVVKAVVGIGLNVNNDLDGVDCKAINLHMALGCQLPVDEVICQIATRLDRLLSLPVSTLAAMLKPRLYTLHKTVVLPDGKEGIALDLLPDGSLVVTTAQGTQIVTAGDVIVKEEVC